ncbi:MAG TPA: glycosyltransferase family 2 protein, partial [Candidatus Paceibacterota bacterium]
MKRISVVLPCLNEAEAIPGCIEEALKAFRESGRDGEILVVDNGSTDGSASVAQAKMDEAVRAGSPIRMRVISEPARGYGSAYKAGMNAAAEEVLFMSDADGTYDIADMDRFAKAIENGAEIAIGNRFAGKIGKGVMPWHRQYIGNPFLSYLVRKIFKTDVVDVHCGARALSSDATCRLSLSSDGMEFASEMIIKAAKLGLRVQVLPISYKPRTGESKLRSFRD